MMLHTPDAVSAILATWPAQALQASGPFTLRRSPGGGHRVTAATWNGGSVPSDTDLTNAETMMRGWQQPPLFLIRDGDAMLDRALADRDYVRRNATRILVAPLADLLKIATPRLSTFDIWPALAIMDEIWDAGGIGEDRRAVMERCGSPKTALLGRFGDRPAAAGFVAVSGSAAVLHALEVRPALRRNGMASRLLGHAARWAAQYGCDHLATAVTEANAEAGALYAKTGFAPRAGYHYRAWPGETA